MAQLKVEPQQRACSLLMQAGMLPRHPLTMSQTIYHSDNAIAVGQTYPLPNEETTLLADKAYGFSD